MSGRCKFFGRGISQCTFTKCRYIHDQESFILIRDHDDLCQNYISGFCKFGWGCGKYHDVRKAGEYAKSRGWEIPAGVEHLLWLDKVAEYKTNPKLLLITANYVRHVLRNIPRGVMTIIVEYININNTFIDKTEDQIVRKACASFYSYGLGCRCIYFQTAFYAALLERDDGEYWVSIVCAKCLDVDTSDDELKIVK